MKKEFTAYFFFVDWDCFSLGFHICFGMPNIEIHLPFGFVHIGWERRFEQRPINHDAVKWRYHGFSRGRGA